MSSTTKMENPWNIESLYNLRYYNCPSCEYKTNIKQKFINHAYNSHPETIYYLKNIKDDSMDDISCPWDPKDHGGGDNFNLNFENVETKIEENSDIEDHDIYFKSEDEEVAEVEYDIYNKSERLKEKQSDLKSEKIVENVEFFTSTKKGLISFTCNICHLSVSRTELKSHFEKCNQNRKKKDMVS